jgi:hypothetical protein
MELYYKIKFFITDTWRDLCARWQRFIRGYSYGDVWDMYDWFIRTLQPMLIHLRDHGYGIPQDCYIESDDERINWEDVLTEMINCLDMMDEDKVYKHFGYDKFHSQWWMKQEDYLKISDTMAENKNRFFELFSKYFYDLWD